jgi:outer membrane protein assembly factor BamB
MNPVRRFLLPAAGIAAILALIAVLARPPAATPQSEDAPAWPMYQRVPSHNAVLYRPHFKTHWLTALGGKINGGLAVSGQTLYAASFDQKLYALDLQSGSVKWSAQASNILMSSPVTDGASVIVGGGKDGFLKPDDYLSQIWGRPQGDDLYAYAAGDGRLLWKLHTVGQNMPSGAIVDGAVILANGDLHAYAVDVQTGRTRWSIALPGVATMASTNVDRGTAFISTCHNAPYVCETRAIDVRDGSTRWTNPYGGSDCSPTVDAGRVFVNATRDDTLRYHTGGIVTVAAIDESSGKTLWTFDGPPGPYTYVATQERQIAGVTSGGALYQSIGNADRVVALDERTGKLLWTFHTSANVKMSPVVRGGVVYFGDTSGIFYRVDRRTGRLIHASSYLQPFSASPPIIVGDTLFVADGNLIVASPVDDV